MKTKTLLLLTLLASNVMLTTMAILFYPFSSVYKQSEDRYLFTFVHVTDSHFDSTNEILQNATSWLAQQEDILFVVHTGDIVSLPSNEAAWKAAYETMHRLDGRQEWRVLAGDNDAVSRNGVDLANYRKYFTDNPTDQFIVVGEKLLFILLGWSSGDGSISSERLSWMEEVIQRYKGMYVVLCLHPPLYGGLLLRFMDVPNADEVWSLVHEHPNIVMTLSGHIHRNWVSIHINRGNKVWSVSTEALKEKGYVRVFDTYENRIESYGYSTVYNRPYTGVLDRFTIELNPTTSDVDGDLWSDGLDIMPTHPAVPNGVLTSSAVTAVILAYLMKERKRLRI